MSYVGCWRQAEMEGRCKVCVTGGSSYIGCALVKKLLDKGYTVHTTLTNLKEESKTGLLRGLLPADAARLVLFQADVYKPEEYAPAIQGCHFVFHLATPLQHQPNSQFKDMTEAAVAAMKSILRYCTESGTVRRLIYTGSVTSASPMKVDDAGTTTGYKDFIDETCWTPLNHSFPYNHRHKGYTESKTMAERELLLSEENVGGDGTLELEVVSLVVGLVGGDTLLSYTPYSVAMLVSPLKDDQVAYESLKYLEDLDGKIPVAHVHDVCEAHIFCAENPSITSRSRFMLATAYASSPDIANYYLRNYPQFNLKTKYLEEGPKREIKWTSTKLVDEGFVYKYDNLHMILDDCIRCATRMGDL